MSIESINNTNINVGSLPSYQSSTDSYVQDNENIELKSADSAENTELLSAPSAKNFSEDSEEQKKQLDSAIEKLNETARVFSRSLKFSIHEETHRTVVSVVDTDTDKVIRQIPGEEVLDMVAKMQEYLGMIFDKKA